MLRGYRYIFCLLVGCLALFAGSPSGKASQHEEWRTEQEVSNSLGRVANALDEANKPKRETADCTKGTDDRQSDLCAQWKAADAAAQAADAADTTVTIGWIGVVLGTVTMGAAIAAAFFAKRAADETKRTADAADKSHAHSLLMSAAQVRPYVTAGRATLKHIDGDKWRVRARIRNAGSIPAFNVNIGLVAEFRTRPAKRFIPGPAVDSILFDNISPNPKHASISRTIDLSEDQVESIRNYLAGVLVFVSVRYSPLDHLPVEEKVFEMLIVGEDIDKKVCRIPSKWFFGGPDKDGQFELDL